MGRTGLRTERREGSRRSFAAMPRLEAKKLLFRMTAAENGKRRAERREELVLMFIDVRKAHLNAVCHEDAYVVLPPEFKAGGKIGN